MDRLNGRRLVIWGTGRDAKYLYTKLRHKKININFFISKDYNKTPFFSDCYVYPKTVLNREKHYVIIASTAFASEIKQELNELEFKEIIDFSTWIEFDSFSYPSGNIEHIFGVYDSIFSLGSNCACAQNLLFHGLRKYAGPFDWFNTDDVTEITRGLDDEFKENFLPLNMTKTSEDIDASHESYLDVITKFYSTHDIKKNAEDKDKQLQELKDKFDRRVHRFYNIIRNSTNTLFLRREVSSTIDELLLLGDKLELTFKTNSTLLVIGESPTVTPICRKLSENIYLYLTPFVNNNHFAWMGNVHFLYRIFYNIDIKANTQLKYYINIINIVKKFIGDRIIIILGKDYSLPFIEALLSEGLGEKYLICTDTDSSVYYHRNYYIIFSNKEMTKIQKQSISNLNYNLYYDYINFNMELS